MLDHLAVFTAIGLGLGLMLASTQVSVAQQNPVTAIDIALKRILETRDQAINTTTYIVDMNGHPHKICDSAYRNSIPGFELPPIASIFPTVGLRIQH